jgi:hypothetical protein
MDASYLPRHEAHFKSLTLAPCGEGLNCLLVAQSFELSVAEELPGAFKEASGFDVGGERMKSLVEDDGFRISSSRRSFGRLCSARPAPRTCATSFSTCMSNYLNPPSPEVDFFHLAVLVEGMVGESTSLEVEREVGQTLILIALGK